MSCVFCDLPGDEPDKVLAQNEHAYVVEARGWSTEGYLLVIPRRHIEAFDEPTNEEAGAIWRLTEYACERVRCTTGCKSVSVSLNDGHDAGQRIPHFHWWVIGRPAGEFPYGMATLLKKINERPW